jgi:hypothetical protein
MQDQILDWLVVILPFLLSVWGILVTLEPLDKRHKTKWRVALFLSGVIVSTLTYRQQETQRARAQASAISIAAEQDRKSAEKFNAFNDSLAAALRSRSQQRSIAAPKPPTADEIAAALSEKLKGLQQPTPTTPTPSPERNTASRIVVVPTPAAPTPTPPPAVQLCLQGRLRDCSDEQLLAWGKPLVAKIETIENDYMADLKKLDDIKSGWLGEIAGDLLIGVNTDGASKRSKAMTLAEQRVGDRFRDCCAEAAIEYHKELVLRTGDRSDQTAEFEWTQNLLKPIKSKEWKKARQDAGKIIHVVYDLQFLQIDLDIIGIQQRH